jgi:hypothetical protein
LWRKSGRKEEVKSKAVRLACGSAAFQAPQAPLKNGGAAAHRLTFDFCPLTFAF